MMTWRIRAACLDEDPELSFPVGNTGPALLQIEEAKAVCRRCQVVETCLESAMKPSSANRHSKPNAGGQNQRGSVGIGLSGTSSGRGTMAASICSSVAGK